MVLNKGLFAARPVLFSLFSNELALEIIEIGRHGATPTSDVELFILLLTDDIVLLSETPVGLHTQLNSLHRAACTYQICRRVILLCLDREVTWQQERYFL